MFLRLEAISFVILAVAGTSSCNRTSNPAARSYAQDGAPASSSSQQPALFHRVDDKTLRDQNPAIAARIDKIKGAKTTASVTIVSVDSTAATHPTLMMDLPQIGALAAVKTAGEQTSEQTFSWLGSLQNGEPGGATLIVHGQQVTGTVSTSQAVYRITPLSGTMHALVKLDSTKFPADEPQFFSKMKPGFVSHIPTKTSHAADVKSGAPTSPSDVVPQVDVAVAYTPAAKAAINAVGNLDDIIRLAVAEANHSYELSHVSVRLNLVDTFQITYVEAGQPFEKILAAFKGNADVNSRRTKSGADISVLLIDQGEYCGLADAIRATADSAFAIVHYDCATGYYSFAHEIGHLFGARHNEQMDPSNDPYPYGHGYLDHEKWRTIMAYDCPNHCNRLQYWSNPDISYGGEPMGTTGNNNNTRVLNENAARVAAFRPHK